MSKHILLYSDDPGTGGVAQYNHTLLCSLVALGYRLTCVQNQSSNPMVTARQQLGIEHMWIELDTTEEPMLTTTDQAYAQKMQRIAQCVDQSHAQKILEIAKPDLIIVSDGLPIANSGIKQVAIKMGIPFMVVIGLVDHFREEKGLSSVYINLVANELSRFYRRAKAVIAVSKENLNLLHRDYGLPEDKGQVIYYGRGAKYFAPRDQLVRNRLRQELEIPLDAVVCLTSARLDPAKGHHHQLAAIERLKTTDIWDSLYFVWAGGGQLENQLRGELNRLQVTDKVKMLGQRWDIPDWLETSDIFVLTSEVEGMPLAIMEAMAKGLPVIATAVSGVPEELGDTGKLLPDPKIDPEATVNELVTTIQAWCANPELLHAIAKACKTRAEQMFKEERMLSETHAVIESALKSNWDYVSPGFELIRPDDYFPNMIVGNTANSSSPYLRWDIPHNWYVDRRQPNLGFLNRDEAHIVYNTALKFQGKKALEIGCWLGWSASHLALAGVELDVVDTLLEKPDFYKIVSSSLLAAGVLSSVNLVAGHSSHKVKELAKAKERKWSLIFIEGNYQAPAPLYDAMLCEKYAESDALILFHNLASPDVAQGWEYLRQQGWNVMIYQTMQIMGVAWRGNVEPVMHQPDPQVNWSLPRHLQHYPVSGLSIDSPINNSISTLINQLFDYVEQCQHDCVIPPVLTKENIEILANWNHQAKQAWGNGDFDQALVFFQKAIEVNPYSRIAHNYLNLLFWEKGDVKKSIEHHIQGQNGNYLFENSFDEFIEIITAISPYTMLSGAQLFSLYSLAKQICLDDIAGNFVECGTCKGGSAALLAVVIKRYSLQPRLVYAFDTFEGMPEPTEIDKHKGIPANDTGLGVGTFKAPISENLHVVCQALDVRDIVVPVQGLFAQTLPESKSQIGSIALLHADSHWYKSTMAIFNSLYDNVVANGIIQVNDYGFWEGCRKAIHDFEREQGVSFALRAINEVGVWFNKEDPVAHECNHWQTFWHLAQTADKMGDLHLAKKAAGAVLQIMPRLTKAEELLEHLGKTSNQGPR